jgi:dihydroflavonol-4-reductase
MTNLVTGGTGFVGGAIVEQLLAAKQKVRALARPSSNVAWLQAAGVEIVHGDVLDTASLERAMQGVDTLYHAAAQYELWTAKPQLMLDTANQGTRNILDAALAAGVKKVLHTSSAAAFGLPRNQTVTEAATAPGLLPDVYYRSKYESEQIAQTYVAKGLHLVILNPTVVYGERDTKPLGRSIVSLLNGELPAIWDATMGIVYNPDVARAHLLAAQKAKAGERYILAERTISYREFFSKVIELGGGKMPPLLPRGLVLTLATASEFMSRFTKQMPLVSVMQLKAGTQGTRFDGSKAERELGLKYTATDEALRNTLTWFWEHGDLKKKPLFLETHK